MHKLNLIFLYGIITIGLTACGEEQKIVEVLRPVRYSKVYSTGGSRVRTFSGAAKSGIESNLSFRISGTVQSLPVKPHGLGG